VQHKEDNPGCKSSRLLLIREFGQSPLQSLFSESDYPGLPHGSILATAQMLDAGRKSEAGVRVPDWATARDQIVAQKIADTRLQTEIWRLIHSRGRSIS
jgi:hypothetical protein